MKKRNFTDIGFVRRGKKNIVLQHLIDEMSVTTLGGGHILTVPCGSGKSTGIVSLVLLFPNESFVIFVKTKMECGAMFQKLRASGVPEDEMMMIYSPDSTERKRYNDYTKSPSSVVDAAEINEIVNIERAIKSYEMMMTNPSVLTTKRILIIPSIHVYTNFLPALFAYSKTETAINLYDYIGKTNKLLKSDVARKFVIFDENADFIKPYFSVDGKLIASHFEITETKKS